MKFNSKNGIFGYPKSKRWVLLPAYSDWTKIRTPLCFKLQDLCGVEWYPKGQNVEFVLNDSLRCNYYLCEQIRVEKNRINIKEMEPTDTVGEALTGGVLFEIDDAYDEKNKFISKIANLPFMLRNPDNNINPSQMNYFESYIDSVEQILYSDEKLNTNEFLKYIDMDSYIRWWLVNELSLNIESFGINKNFYMYKDRGYQEKLHAGPAWDFDWGTFWSDKLAPRWFRSNEAEIWACKNKKWYSRLFTNEVFIKRVKEIWAETRLKLDDELFNYFDDIKNYNKNSVQRDQVMYNIGIYSEDPNSNPDTGKEYDDAYNYIRSFLENRIAFLDERIRNF